MLYNTLWASTQNSCPLLILAFSVTHALDLDFEPNHVGSCIVRYESFNLDEPCGVYISTSVSSLASRFSLALSSTRNFCALPVIAFSIQVVSQFFFALICDYIDNCHNFIHPQTIHKEEIGDLLWCMTNHPMPYSINVSSLHIKVNQRYC